MTDDTPHRSVPVSTETANEQDAVGPRRTSVPIVDGARPKNARVPIFNAPFVVTALLGALGAIHAVQFAFEWLGQAERVAWWQWALAFVPGRYFAHVSDIPGGPIASVTSFVTHTLLHFDVAHLVINGAGLLAFGTAVARRIGALRFLALYAVSGVAGAAIYLASHGQSDAVMIGASGAISGLVGAAFRFLFRMFEARHFGVSAEAAYFVPRMSLLDMATEPRVRLAVLVWLAVNYVVAIATPMAGGGAIAWEAHLGGFLVGLLGFAAFDRVDDTSLTDE
jgi:membrane associated rhomboid family serine protease